MSLLSYVEALNLATHHAMREDDQVLVLGLDVDDHTSIYQSLADVWSQFGPERIFNTPLSEEGATGFAIGAAVAGKKVVQVHIRADFCLLALNQLINMASNMHYLSNGQLNVPLTVRCVIGRGWGQGAQHSKSVHALLGHIPGLKVFLPTRPQDAYSGLKAAIFDPNPCIVLEHRWLYEVTGEVDVTKGFCSSSILRPGSDVTVVANSWMSVEALAAAEALQERGLSCEIIDVGQIAPLHLDAVFQSVKKTGRLLVCDGDWLPYGFSSEVIAQVTERMLPSLRASPVRLGFRHIPCPTARELERHFYPNTQNVADAVCTLMNVPTSILPEENVQSYESRFRGPF